LQPPVGVDFVGVESAAEMFAAVRHFFSRCDCLIMAAAVSDYTPVKKSKIKIQKSNRKFVIKLKPAADILEWAGKNKKKNQIIVGFALEDRDIRSNAERKLRRKNLDMVVANTPAAIGGEQCEVLVKRAGDKWRRISRAPKQIVARRLIRLVEQLALAD
jgi:phosphopantothenoylcysteine decarboxylase/phosphopantothenate--cysteine ligase